MLCLLILWVRSVGRAHLGSFPAPHGVQCDPLKAGGWAGLEVKVASLRVWCPGKDGCKAGPCWHCLFHVAAAAW